MSLFASFCFSYCSPATAVVIVATAAATGHFDLEQGKKSMPGFHYYEYPKLVTDE